MDGIAFGYALGVLYHTLARWTATEDAVEEALWRERVIKQVLSVAHMLDAKEGTIETS